VWHLMIDLARLHKEFINEQRFATRLSEVTLRGYEQSFALLVEVMPVLTTDQVTSGTVTEFFRRLETRTRMVGRGIKKVGVKKSTIATYRSKLNRFFQWLENKKYIKKNPFSMMEYPDVRYEDRKFLSRQDIQKIFTALALGLVQQNSFIQRRNLAIFATLLYTGIRKGELLGLQVTDFDLQRRELTVSAETSKSRLRRIIPISSELMKLLRDYLAERVRRKLTTPFLFASSAHDDRLSADGLKHLTETVQRASGVKFHLHQLRHTFAVNVLNNGSDIAKLKQLLGHRDIRMTATYLRCLPTSVMRCDVETLTLDNLV
jgi:integrase/recombinase XerD